MRIFFKILLFPISLILTIFVALANFLVIRCAGLLNIISGLLFTLAVVGYVSYFAAMVIPDTSFGRVVGSEGSLVPAVSVTALAFLVSPYGLPRIAEWIVEKLGDLNDAIKSI